MFPCVKEIYESKFFLFSDVRNGSPTAGTCKAKIINVVAFVNNIWYYVSTFIVKRWKKTMRYKFLKSVLETYFLRSWASGIEIWRMINDLINDGVFMRIIENQPKKS